MRKHADVKARLAQQQAQWPAMEERLAFLEEENTDLRAQLAACEEREVGSADLRSQNALLRAQVQVLNQQVRDSARQQQRPRGRPAKKYRAKRRGTAPGQTKAMRLPFRLLGGENYLAAAMDGVDY